MSQPLKDAFYIQIITALSGHLDPAVFERSMGDLLRQDLPGLVPVPGGGDSGFDGLIPGGAGAFPLVCTTARDVETNLRKSLKSVTKQGWSGRRVALATSQTLTPQRRLTLFERAGIEGFQMIQVFDRDALADRLYRNSRWCKELLGLSWRPSPLSSVSAGLRPSMNLEPIGREDALSWIRSVISDCVIAGEPGSGKTFLLDHLIRQGWPGLFLASSDFNEQEIVLAYNDQKPEWIVVDDAHASDHLEKLIRLRRGIGADFKILATTWKGSRDEVLQTLGITESQSFQLELLTRDEIVEVFRGMGVQAGDDVLRIMVNQAANKPGLAVTIGTLWLRGEWREVLNGKALLREVLTFFDRTLKQDASSVLAAFSLGGDSGMEQETVRDFLGLPRETVWRVVTQLAVGGVLSETRGGVYAVRPRELRFALLQRAFSPKSAARHDLLDLLDQAPSRASAVETIVASQVDLPPGKLRELVQNAGTRRAWEMLAESGESEASWVLQNYPGDLSSIAGATLIGSPKATIERLLERAVSAAGPMHSQPDHPMSILDHWVTELRISPEERVSRRKLVAAAAGKFLKSEGTRTVGLHGILLALNPALESHSLDPGLGNRVSIFSAAVSLDEIAEIREIWKTHRSGIDSLQTSDWPVVSGLLWGWVYPDYAAKSEQLPRKVEQAMRSFAGMLLKHLAPLAQGKPGLSAGLLNLAEETGVKLKLQRDPAFELLYPTFDSYPDAPKGDDLALKLGEIADAWKGEGPQKAAERLALYESEVRETSRPCWPRRAPDLCKVISDLVEAPEAWLQELLGRELPDDLVQPFLDRIVSDERAGWEEVLRRLLEEERHAGLVLGFLGRLRLPSALMEQILARSSRAPYLVESLCQKGIVPLPTLKALLRLSDQETALAAAVGEWLADPRGAIRAELQADWKAVILSARVEKEAEQGRGAVTSYWLEEILRQDRNLAFEWTRARLHDIPRPHWIRNRGLHERVIAALDHGQRLLLLDELHQGEAPSRFIKLLVGEDPGIFQRVLAIENLGMHRLEPLEKLPDEQWTDLAVAALESGFEGDQIVSASFRGISSWSGSGLSTFQRWDQAFAQLENDRRDTIRELAMKGRSRARERIEQAEAEDRADAIHGI